MQLGYSLQSTNSIPIAPIFTSAVAEAHIVGKLTTSSQFEDISLEKQRAKPNKYVGNII